MNIPDERHIHILNTYTFLEHKQRTLFDFYIIRRRLCAPVHWMDGQRLRV